MKKLATAVVVLGLLGVVAWQYRIELLVWGAPKARQLVSPIPDNVATAWQQGPAVATAPPDQRPPNIILILADDMGFNDVSLYNGGAADGSLMTPNIDAIAEQGSPLPTATQRMPCARRRARAF